MENRTCFKCNKLSDCKKLEELKDENGRVNVQVLNTFASDCSDYFNPKE